MLQAKGQKLQSSSLLLKRSMKTPAAAAAARSSCIPKQFPLDPCLAFLDSWRLRREAVILSVIWKWLKAPWTPSKCQKLNQSYLKWGRINLYLYGSKEKTGSRKFRWTKRLTVVDHLVAVAELLRLICQNKTMTSLKKCPLSTTVRKTCLMKSTQHQRLTLSTHSSSRRLKYQQIKSKQHVWSNVMRPLSTSRIIMALASNITSKSKREQSLNRISKRVRHLSRQTRTHPRLQDSICLHLCRNRKPP